MPDKAVISHRGEKYEIGRGKRFYGIWVVGAPYDAPVDRWPENSDGWRQAWARFAAIEVPGTIEQVGRERKGLRLGWRKAARDAIGGAGDAKAGKAARARSRRAGGLLTGEGLLVLGVVLGLAGLFPAYYKGEQSLLSQADQVVPHLCYVIGWALTAAFVALSVARPNKLARLSALFGLGLSVVTFGLFLSDWGWLTGGREPGFGLVMSTLGWVACTAGTVLVIYASGGPRETLSRPVSPRRVHEGAVALLVLAGIGTAAAFAPSWVSYLFVARFTGATQTITRGNVFDAPGLAIAGSVCVMVAIVAVAAAAATWSPARHGALLLAGAIVPLAAQFASALIHVGQPVSPAQFGIPQAQAAAVGLTITPGLTGIFWVYFVFLIALGVSCAWLFTEPGHHVMPGIQVSPWRVPGTEPGTGAPSDAAVSEDADSGTDAEDADSTGAERDGTDSGTGDRR